MSWHAASLPALSALTALVDLDATHLVHSMASRPIVLGPLLGAVCGDPLSGAAFGAAAEALSLDRSPTGAALPLNGGVAAACAVLLHVSPAAVPAAAALPAGLALGVGHRAVEGLVRSRRSALAEDARRQAEGGSVSWGRLLARGLGTHLAASAAFVYISVAVLAPALAWAWGAAPEAVREGLGRALAAAPWLGAASVARLLWRRAR